MFKSYMSLMLSLNRLQASLVCIRLIAILSLFLSQPIGICGFRGLDKIDYTIAPACKSSIGKIKSQFFPHTIFPFSMVKRLNLRGSRYLLYCGCGWRRIKSPTSIVCFVLSLNVRLTVKLPALSALTIYILSIL